MSEQLRLFPETDTTVKVRIYTESSGVFRAEIAGGWWVARGPTKEAAKRKVVRWYKNERERWAG